MTTALGVSSLIAVMKKLPLIGGDSATSVSGQRKALSGYAVALFPEIFSLSAAKGPQEFVEAFVVAVEPVKLAGGALNEATVFGQDVRWRELVVEQNVPTSDTSLCAQVGNSGQKQL